ncbi:SagB family peptide dehydrogenase [Sorangium sp. So ce233]|uniref:SagB family peptide dehydrogenase n=1 Tax=Sorangium sp. So ce233 TaxID=3133290 RepID=UPI003F5FFD80
MLRLPATAKVEDILRIVSGHLPLDPGMVAVIERLGRGATVSRLRDIYQQETGESVSIPLFHLLSFLDQLGLLCWSLELDGEPLLTAHPTGPPSGCAGVLPAATAVYRLSRFALIRREGGVMIVESPAAWAQAIVHDRALMPLLHDLGEAASCSELVRRSPGLPEHAVSATLALLHRAGLVCRADDDASFGEDSAPGPAMWGFHDLLFHARTRRGTNLEQLGRTYPFRGRFDPPPALESPSGAARVSLPRPDLARLVEDDPPLAAVVEARRSVRRHGAVPLSLGALGELLFRTLRVRSLSPPNAERAYEFTDRPYPSGGACYPLDVYLAVARCAGLDPGLVRYVPEEHALERVCERNGGVDRLLQDAAHATGVGAPPQVLIILAARFARVSWSYGPLAYNLILKEVGVVFHAVYLAATAMGLGACALGVGNSRLFAELAGVDSLVKTSVGEILLGSRPETPG